MVPESYFSQPYRETVPTQCPSSRNLYIVRFGLTIISESRKGVADTCNCNSHNRSPPVSNAVPRPISTDCLATKKNSPIDQREKTIEPCTENFAHLVAVTIQSSTQLWAKNQHGRLQKARGNSVSEQEGQETLLGFFETALGRNAKR